MLQRCKSCKLKSVKCKHHFVISQQTFHNSYYLLCVCIYTLIVTELIAILFFISLSKRYGDTYTLVVFCLPWWINVDGYVPYIVWRLGSLRDLFLCCVWRPHRIRKMWRDVTWLAATNTHTVDMYIQMYVCRNICTCTSTRACAERCAWHVVMNSPSMQTDRQTFLDRYTCVCREGQTYRQYIHTHACRHPSV